MRITGRSCRRNRWFGIGRLLVLVPVLILGVRGAEVDRWEGEVSRLEARTRARAPAPGAVLFYGSSSFRLWTNLPAVFPGIPLVNHGFGGSELSDLYDFVDRLVVPVAPRLVIVYGGDNDLAGGKTPERVLADFQRLVVRLRQRLPGVRIAFAAIKPSPSRAALLEPQRRANDLVRRFVRLRRKLDFLDTARPLLGPDGQPEARYFAADRLHLNPEGYEVWRRILEPYLQRWAGPRRPGS